MRQREKPPATKHNENGREGKRVCITVNRFDLIDSNRIADDIATKLDRNHIKRPKIPMIFLFHEIPIIPPTIHVFVCIEVTILTAYSDRPTK